MRAILSVIGKDKVGITAAVCKILSERNINILDISQTILQDYFTMIMLVDISGCELPFADLVDALKALGNEQGLEIHMQREEIFEAMHRI